MSGPISIKNVPMDYFLKGLEAVQAPQAPGPSQGTGQAAAPEEAGGGARKAPGAGSLLKQLDVLLMQAATGGTGAIGDKSVEALGKKLKEANLLSKAEGKALAQCAAKAQKTFAALSRFTGAQLGSAFKVVDGKTTWDEKSAVAKACQDAIAAQNDLSDALAKLGRRMARSDADLGRLDEGVIEMRLTCDRRASEVQSLAVQMHEFALYAAGRGEAADPNVKAILGATVVELLPRQALAMHGTADVLEGKGSAAAFAQSLRPLAARIDAFAANPGGGVDEAELAGIRADISRMRAAVADVREHGIPSGNGRMMVAKDVLRALEAALDKADKAFSDAKAAVADALRRNMLGTMEDLLDLSQEQLDQFVRRFPASAEMLQEAQDFLGDLDRYVEAAGKDPKAAETKALFDKALRTAKRLHERCGTIPQEAAKAMGTEFYRAMMRAKGAFTVMSEFQELDRRMEAAPTERVLTGEVARSVFSGKVSVPNVVEARTRGLRDADVDPATEPGKLASSQKLGGGEAGEVWELTSTGGETFVFKGESESRGGLVNLQVGVGAAYGQTQQTVQLGIASRTVAERLGCGDRIVKYSVGSHKGTFGMFMEKARGMSAKSYLRDPGKAPPGGLSANQIRALPEADRRRVRGEIRRQLNQLHWLDSISGQLDRHYDNYFIFVDEKTREVTVRGIDNDASFPTVATGLGKFHLDLTRSAQFLKKLSSLAVEMNPRHPEQQLERLLQDPGLVRHDDGTVEVDTGKMRSAALGACLKYATGAQIATAPAVIDREMYDELMALKNDPARRQAFLDDLRDRLSPEALAAQEKRLDDAIAHAEQLAALGHVVEPEMWGGIEEGTRGEGKVKIENSDGRKVTLGEKDSHSVLVLFSPSIFHRDQLEAVF